MDPLASCRNACIGCGYDLRGLQQHGQCPECGTPIGLSIDPNWPQNANPDWLKKIRRGISLLALGTAFPVFAYLALLGAAAMSAALFAFALDPWFWLAHKVIALATVGLVTIGAVNMATQEPRASLHERPVCLRTIVRCAAFCTCVAVLVREPLIRYAGTFVGSLALHASALALAFFVTVFLSQLARRMSNTRLDRAVRRTAYGAAISVVLLASGFTAAGSIGLVVSWVAVVSTLNGYLRALRRHPREGGDPAAGRALPDATR